MHRPRSLLFVTAAALAALLAVLLPLPAALAMRRAMRSSRTPRSGGRPKRSAVVRGHADHIVSGIGKAQQDVRPFLQQVGRQALIAQEARTRKMGPTDADVEARIAKIKGNFPNDDAFQKGIAAQGLTVEALRAQAKLSLEVARFLEAEVSSKIAVTDSEVDAFYKQNLDRFKQAEAVHARHILIGVPADASAADRSKARQTAQSVVGQLKRGARFEDMARKLSTDTASAQNGGDVGFFPKGQMTPAFEQAAFALKPGQTSGVKGPLEGQRLIESPVAARVVG
jgi:peptidyl-prolyl cis-trans isomerase C